MNLLRIECRAKPFYTSFSSQGPTCFLQLSAIQAETKLRAFFMFLCNRFCNRSLIDCPGMQNLSWDDWYHEDLYDARPHALSEETSCKVLGTAVWKQWRHAHSSCHSPQNHWQCHTATHTALVGFWLGPGLARVWPKTWNRWTSKPFITSVGYQIIDGTSNCIEATVVG